MKNFKDFIAAIIKYLSGPVSEIGEYALLTAKSFYWALRPPYRLGLLFSQMYQIGVGSLFIILLVGAFTGMVMSLQSIYAFEMFQAEGIVGATVILALTRELSPVLSALMVTGRAGSAMTTELGTMRVTEQIDALAAMAVNPVQYLMVPRIIATTLMMPVLTMLFNFIGLWGSWLVSVQWMGVGDAVFFEKIRMWLDVWDIMAGLIKAAVFGFFIASISCYKGYNALGGARGVGLATTQAVVINSVMIFAIDYFMTPILFFHK